MDRPANPRTVPTGLIQGRSQDRVIPTVEYAIERHIATITLNRPEALNTVSPEMYADFNAATKLRTVRDAKSHGATRRKDGLGRLA